MPSVIASNAIPLTQVSLAYTGVGATYAIVGTFSSWVEVMNIVSTCNAVIIVSFDGVNDHVTMPAGNTTPSIISFNFKANLMAMANPSIYAKTAGSPSTGSISANAFSAAIQ